MDGCGFEWLISGLVLITRIWRWDGGYAKNWRRKAGRRGENAEWECRNDHESSTVPCAYAHRTHPSSDGNFGSNILGAKAKALVNERESAARCLCGEHRHVLVVWTPQRCSSLANYAQSFERTTYDDRRSRDPA